MDYLLPILATVALGGGTASAPVLPQVASASLLLNLQADAGVTQVAGAVSKWADQSGNGHDFVQATGVSQPLVQTVGGKAEILFDGSNDYLIGPNFADNLDSFAVFAVAFTEEDSITSPIISKYDHSPDPSTGAGWLLQQFDAYAEIDAPAAPPSMIVYATQYTDFGSYYLYNFSMTDRSHLHLYKDGVEVLDSVTLVEIPDFSNSAQVIIDSNSNAGGPVNSKNHMHLHAILIYSPAPSDADRMLIENWLKAKWGL